MTDISALDPARVAPDAANPLVRDVMRREVVFCLPSTPVDAVAKLMSDNDLGEVPVLIDRRPVGYVTARDIVGHLVAGNIAVTGSDMVRPAVTDVLARDILRTPPLLVDENDQLWEVVSLMRRQQRGTALVMHDDDRPVGMLTVIEITDNLLAQGVAAGTGAHHG